MSISTPILRNTAALAVAKLTEKGASIALSFLIARQLGASSLGIYAASIVFLGLLAVSAEMGATSFLVREIARDRKRTPEYLTHFGILTLVFSLIVVAITWIALPHLGYSAELTASIYIVSFATVAVALKAIQEAAFLAHQKVEFITYVTLVGSLLNVGTSLWLLHSGHGVVALIAVYSAVQFGIVVSYGLLINHYIAPLKCSFQVTLAIDLVRRVRAFAGSSLLGALLARPEVLILSLFHDDAQIGFYSAALQIVLLWQVIPETYMRNLYPVLSQAHRDADRGASQPLIGQSVKYLLAMSLPLASGIFVAARPIVDLIYGPGFEPSVPLVRIMAFCIPLAFLFELLWRLLAARDQQGLMFRAQAFMAAVRLGGGYALIAWLASTGAAVSTLLVTLLHISLLAFYARRQDPELGILRHAWRLSLAAVGMGTFAAVLVNRSHLWVVVLAAAVFYAGLAVLLRAISPDEFGFIRKTGAFRTTS
jgi:O-antigen/teichoic acid export membrane protein